LYALVHRIIRHEMERADRFTSDSSSA